MVLWAWCAVLTALLQFCAASDSDSGKMSTERDAHKPTTVPYRVRANSACLALLAPTVLDTNARVTSSIRKQCPQQDSCLDQCFHPTSNSSCSCQMDCLLFGDCCFDFFPVCLKTSIAEVLDAISYKNATSRISPTRTSSNDFINGTMFFKPKCFDSISSTLTRNKTPDLIENTGCVECYHVKSFAEENELGYKLVSKCPQSWSDLEVKALCENQTSVTSDNPPFHDIQDVSLSYHNLHCARCHGRSSQKLRPWNLTLTCPKSDYTGTLVKDPDFTKKCCISVFTPILESEFVTRRCCGAKVSVNAPRWNLTALKLACEGVQGTEELVPLLPSNTGAVGIGFWSLGFPGPSLPETSDEIGGSSGESLDNDEDLDPTPSLWSEYLTWCHIYHNGSLDFINETIPCSCPTRLDDCLESIERPIPFLKVTLSALFSLDMNYGISVTYSLQDAQMMIGSVPDIGCVAGEIQYEYDCRWPLCNKNQAEEEDDACLVVATDNIFPPEGKYNATVTFEVRALLCGISEPQEALEPSYIGQVFLRFLDEFVTPFHRVNLSSDAWQNGWTKVGRDSRDLDTTWGDSLSTESLVHTESLQSPSNCNDIPVDQLFGNTTVKFRREVATMRNFRFETVVEVFNFKSILNRVRKNVYLDEVSHMVFVFSSIIIRNFNHSAGIVCEGEIKASNVSRSIVDESDLFVVLNGRGIQYNKVMVSDIYVFRYDDWISYKGHAVVCQQFGHSPENENCTSWIGLPHYSQNSRENGLFVDVNGTEIKVEHFYNTSSVLYICRDDLKRVVTNVLVKYEEIELILNYVGFSLSLLALFATFLTYSLMPELRNLPGKIVMCFCVSMFSAILLFMLGAGKVEQDVFCFVVAVLLHYLWLTSFLWINVLAFDVCRVFSDKGFATIASERNQKKWITVYIMYAVGVPVLIICGTLTVGFVNNSSSMLHGSYGHNKFCWIRETLAPFVFYCPIGITLLINLGFFARSVCGIRKVSAIAEAASIKGDHQRNAFLFVKLSLVMGLSWLLFYLLGHIANVAVRTVCSAVNSLQGTFVFAAFVCNKRVWRFYRKMLNKRLASFERRTATSSSGNSSSKPQSVTSSSASNNSSKRQPI